MDTRQILHVDPITLEGEVVRLEPLQPAHGDDLVQVAGPESIWRYLPYGHVNTPQKMTALIEMLLAQQETGSDLPFAVIHRGQGRAIGMTRYLDIRPAHRGLEIGGTWYGVDYQRTAVNTEAKLLLLRHAFEVLGCIRVQFKTDARNVRSQRAITRLGARQEGTLRQHVVMPDGYYRDTIYYSILDREWAAVKEGLLNKLNR